MQSCLPHLSCRVCGGPVPIPSAEVTYLPCPSCQCILDVQRLSGTITLTLPGGPDTANPAINDQLLLMHLLEGKNDLERKRTMLTARAKNGKEILSVERLVAGLAVAGLFAVLAAALQILLPLIVAEVLVLAILGTAPMDKSMRELVRVQAQVQQLDMRIARMRGGKGISKKE